MEAWKIYTIVGVCVAVVAGILVIYLINKNKSKTPAPPSGGLPNYPSGGRIKLTNNASSSFSTAFNTSDDSTSVNIYNVPFTNAQPIVIPVPTNSYYVTVTLDDKSLSICNIGGKMYTIYKGLYNGMDHTASPAVSVAVTTDPVVSANWTYMSNAINIDIVSSENLTMPNIIPFATVSYTGTCSLPSNAVNFPSTISITPYDNNSTLYSLDSSTNINYGIPFAGGSNYTSNVTTSPIALGVVPVDNYVVITSNLSMFLLYNLGGKALLMPILGSRLALSNIAVNVPAGYTAPNQNKQIVVRSLIAEKMHQLKRR